MSGAVLGLACASCSGALLLRARTAARGALGSYGRDLRTC